MDSKHLLSTYCVSNRQWGWSSEQSRSKKTGTEKRSPQDPLTELAFSEDTTRVGWEKLTLSQGESENSAHLVLQASFEVSHKISGLEALELPALHRLAPQEVIHLDGEDGSRCALILGTLFSCREQMTALQLAGKQQY